MCLKVDGLQRVNPLSWGRPALNSILSALVLLVFVILPDTSSGAIGGRDGVGSYFAQGQAVANETDRASSRRDAIFNMQVQAVTQAAGAFISPSEMGARFDEMYAEILGRPEKYVQTYQIFSEMPSEGGLFKVTGMVGVSLDLLRGDFVRLGFLEEGASKRRESELETPGASPAQLESIPEESPALPVEITQGGPLPAASEAAAGQTAARDVLWVVPENWDDGYRLPQGPNDLSALLSQSILQESDDFSWRIVFPDPTGFAQTESGVIDSDAALEAARRMEVLSMVLGRVTLLRSPEGERRIESHLRVFEVPSGRLRGEVREVVNLEAFTMEEGALRMASEAVPKLDSLFQEVGRVAAPEAPAEKTEIRVDESPLERGVTEVHVVSSNAFAQWLDLEKLLREKAPDFVIQSLELGHGEAVVRVTGVNAEFLQGMDGTAMSNDLLLRVERLQGAESRVRVGFEPIPVHEDSLPGSEIPKEEAEVEKAQ